MQTTWSNKKQKHDEETMIECLISKKRDIELSTEKKRKREEKTI